MSERERTASKLDFATFEIFVSQFWRPKLVGMTKAGSRSVDEFPDSVLVGQTFKRGEEARMVVGCTLVDVGDSKYADPALLYGMLHQLGRSDWPADKPWPTGKDKKKMLWDTVTKYGPELEKIGIMGAFVELPATASHPAKAEFQTWGTIATRLRSFF